MIEVTLEEIFLRLVRLESLLFAIYAQLPGFINSAMSLDVKESIASIGKDLAELAKKLKEIDEKKI